MRRWRKSGIPGAVLYLLAAPPATAVEVEVLALFTDRAMVVVDGHRYTLKSGESTPGGVRLISAYSEEAVLEIDGRQVVRRLTSTVGGHFTPREMEEVQLWNKEGELYLADGSINGRQVRFVVDTGASFIALSSADAERLGIEYRSRGRPGRVHTASGTAEAHHIRLDRVGVGGIELFNVEAAVLEGDSPRLPLLGMSFLNQVEMEHSGTSLVLRKGK